MRLALEALPGGRGGVVLWRWKSPAGLLAACPRRAAVDVVVDQSHRLHERVAGRGSDEGKAALLQVLA